MTDTATKTDNSTPKILERGIYVQVITFGGYTGWNTDVNGLAVGGFTQMSAGVGAYVSGGWTFSKEGRTATYNAGAGLATPTGLTSITGAIFANRDRTVTVQGGFGLTDLLEIGVYAQGKNIENLKLDWPVGMPNLNGNPSTSLWLERGNQLADWMNPPTKQQPIGLNTQSYRDFLDYERFRRHLEADGSNRIPEENRMQNPLAPSRPPVSVGGPPTTVQTPSGPQIVNPGSTYVPQGHRVWDSGASKRERTWNKGALLVEFYSEFHQISS